jgi:hypothetical protein
MNVTIAGAMVAVLYSCPVLGGRRSESLPRYSTFASASQGGSLPTSARLLSCHFLNQNERRWSMRA